MGEVTGTIKTFFEVFPTLKAEEELAFLFRDVEVKKITTNSSRDFLHVHIFSHHVIQKKQIHRMEQRIKEQLFGTARVSIRIEGKVCAFGTIYAAGSDGRVSGEYFGGTS